MQINIEPDDNGKAISLDEIIDMVVDNAESDPENEKFDFIKMHNQKIMTEIKNYTRHIRKPEFDNISDKKLECIAEIQSSELFDAVYMANIAYLKSGMKLGARLLLDLLF